MQPFNEPAVGDRVNPRDIVGALLIVKPLDHVQGITTPYSAGKPGGVSDAVALNLVNLDEPNDMGQAGHVYFNVMWFQGHLIRALKRCIGTILLGRIERSTAKPGQQAPFMFVSATGDNTAVARAQAWLVQHPEFAAGQAPTPTQQVVSNPQGFVPVTNSQQQQTVLEQLRRSGQQPFPTSGQNFPQQQQPGQGFQQSAPF